MTLVVKEPGTLDKEPSAPGGHRAMYIKLAEEQGTELNEGSEEVEGARKRSWHEIAEEVPPDDPYCDDARMDDELSDVEDDVL